MPPQFLGSSEGSPDERLHIGAESEAEARSVPYGPQPRRRWMWAAGMTAAAIAIVGGALAVHTVLAASSSPKLVHRSVFFQPGLLGIRANWTAGTVEHLIENQQAQHAGVETGWKFLTIDGEPYSEKLLDEKINGKQPYFVVFKARQDTSTAEDMVIPSHVSPDIHMPTATSTPPPDTTVTSTTTTTSTMTTTTRQTQSTSSAVTVGPYNGTPTEEDFLVAGTSEISRQAPARNWSLFHTLAEMVGFHARESSVFPDGNAFHLAAEGLHKQTVRRAQQNFSAIANYTQWQQIRPDVPVVVYANKSTGAPVITTHPPGTVFVGRREQDWLALSLEPGYVAIASEGKPLLWQRSSVYVRLSSGRCEDVGAYTIVSSDVCEAAAVALGLPAPLKEVQVERAATALVDGSAGTPGCLLLDGSVLLSGSVRGRDSGRYEAICSTQPFLQRALLPFTTGTLPTTSTTRTTSTTTTTVYPSLFCFSVFRPGTAEEDLIRAQIEHNAGIVACDNCALITSTSVTLPRGRDGRKIITWVIEKNVQASFSGRLDEAHGLTTNSWLNTAVFVYAWGAVLGNTSIGDEVYKYDWVIKTDPDAVLIPNRLRVHLKDHTGGPRYLTNCWGKLFGAVEAFSREAMERYRDHWVQKCLPLPWHGWGEDMYMRVCMDRLGVWSFDDTGVVGDARCNYAPCWNKWRAAFHDFKDVAGWLNCWYQAGSPDY